MVICKNIQIMYNNYLVTSIFEKFNSYFWFYNYKHISLFPIIVPSNRLWNLENKVGSLASDGLKSTLRYF